MTTNGLSQNGHPVPFPRSLRFAPGFWLLPLPFLLCFRWFTPFMPARDVSAAVSVFLKIVTQPHAPPRRIARVLSYFGIETGHQYHDGAGRGDAFGGLAHA